MTGTLASAKGSSTITPPIASGSARLRAAVRRQVVRHRLERTALLAGADGPDPARAAEHCSFGGEGTPYAELGLADPGLSDDQLLDAMLAHPILINRPIVVSPKGVRLCRPSEAVLDLLPPQRGELFKEDGARVVDEHGRRVAQA